MESLITEEKTMRSAALLCLLLAPCIMAAGALHAALPDIKSAATEPAGWRGDGSGIYPGAEPPLEWSAKTNVAWQTAVGSGYSSPVVVGDRVIVTAEPDRVVCVNAAEGKVLWSTNTTAADLPEADRANVTVVYGSGTSGNAAATPVSDGRRVYVVFGNGLVSAFALENGKRAWLRHINTSPRSSEGRSSSPILADGKLLVHLTTLQALDPATGRVLWTQTEAEDAYGTSSSARIGALNVAITPRGDVVRVADGKILAKEFASAAYSSPVVQQGVVYLADSACVAGRLPDAISNDEVKVKEVWSADSPASPVYSSPVLHEGLLYVVASNGKLATFDIQSRTMTETALPIGGEGGGPTVYASVALAGGRLFVGDDGGKTVVLEPGKNPKVIRTNELPEGSGATPAFAGRRIFVRSGDNLCCLAEPHVK